MFEYSNYYKLFNARAAARYQKEYEQLLWIADEMKPHKGLKEARLRYLKYVAQLLCRCYEMEGKWNTEYFTQATREQLRKDQEILYGDLQRSRYGKTILNPGFAAKVLGREEGPILSAVASMMRRNIRYAYRHMQFAMEWNQSLFLDLFQLLNQDRQVRTEEIRQLLEEHALVHAKEKQGLMLHDLYGFEDIYRRQLIETLDWSDPLNLYALGEPVSRTELEMSAFMASLPEETIEKMAVSFVQGYRKGFFRNGKDILGRRTVGIIYPLGMERMIARAIVLFREEIHYIPYIRRITTTAENKQYLFDHRFDMAAYVNEAYFTGMTEALEEAVENNREMIQAFGGPAVVEGFGETPFRPQTKKDALTFSEEQQRAYTAYSLKRQETLYRFASPEYTSFTMMAFPLPVIGEHFAEIFAKTVEINTLDEARYEQAQQAIIDTLDQGRTVVIEGANGNETSLTVVLHPLENARQTNFFNCLADVNIPVGEVFTSPVLEGTNGLLHVQEAYLEGLRFEDLRLTFTDGYVTDYSCKAQSPEEGRRYIEENLLFPHQTLPMGEFAIGTNTTAYRMAGKYGITGLLPILIAEKMGPHFAIGDTCFAHEESRTILNPVNGKEIIAKSNELSDRRLEDPEQAYTGKHIDIVLPFDGIHRITAVNAAGKETDIIRGGRFVLRGTDILNDALNEAVKEGV